MPLNQTSIYTLLSDQERIDLFVGNQIVSRLHNLLQISPSLFKVCERESWWVADDEKKFTYELQDKSLKLWPEVENVAAGFAGAAYLFKSQPELIRDFATVFVSKNACKMAEVFACETADEIFEEQSEAARTMMPEIFRKELPAGMPWNRSEKIEENFPGEIEHHIDTKFGVWGQNFLLDLLKWKKPKVDVESDAVGDSKSDDSTGVPPSDPDIPKL